MKRRLYIPDEVKVEIRKHISDKYSQALDGFLSASEEEDTLTGDLGATLRIKNQKILVNSKQTELPGEWTWSINYYKFRGRGPGATENRLGADGLFELTLIAGSRIEKKTILFQSKIAWTNDVNLLEEAVKLTTWREASFILNFTATEIEAIDLDSVINCKGKRNDGITIIPLDKFIGVDFLDCKVGDVDLKYDARTRRLIWRTMNDEVVSTKFSIPQRIAIQVIAPNQIQTPSMIYDKEIGVEEIHDHRMYASAEEILSLKDGFTGTELRKSLASKALIYHPDTLSFNDIFLNNLNKRRMQEINNAYDSLKTKGKKNNKE